METTNILEYIILSINFLIYGLSLFFILKFKSNKVFSIRSPLLLLLNNLGGFLMSTTIIFYHIVSNNDNLNQSLFCKTLPNNYIIFNCILFISFALRYHRLISTCTFQESESEIRDISYIIKNQNTLVETFYAKIFFTCIILISFFSIIISITSPSYSISPYQFDECHILNISNSQYLSLCWITIGFFENILLIYFCSLIIFNKKLNLGVRNELIIFTIIWFIQHILLRSFEKDIGLLPYNSYYLSLIHILFLWICLFLNSYLPLIYIFKQRTKIEYSINTEILKNLYVFLSNQRCVFNFIDYLKSISEKSIKNKAFFTLTLYTDLLSYRLYFTIEEDYQKILFYSKRITDKYFIHPDDYLRSLISDSLINKLSYYSNINKMEMFLEQFDEVIHACFLYLNIHFNLYIQSRFFKILEEEITTEQNTKEALFSVGLIERI